MQNGIYQFRINDFIQFKGKNPKGGILIHSQVGQLHNPRLCYAQLNLYVSPSFSELNRGQTTITLPDRRANASYQLSRDMRRTPCPSCSPLSHKIDKGIILGGTNAWALRLENANPGECHVDLGQENDFWYVDKDGNREIAIKAKLDYIAGRINLEQQTLESIGAVFRAPEIKSADLQQMLDFIKQTRPSFFE